MNCHAHQVWTRRRMSNLVWIGMRMSFNLVIGWIYWHTYSCPHAISKYIDSLWLLDDLYAISLVLTTWKRRTTSFGEDPSHFRIVVSVLGLLREGNVFCLETWNMKKEMCMSPVRMSLNLPSIWEQMSLNVECGQLWLQMSLMRDDD